MTNSGNYNSGNYNSGDYNSGNYNSGDCNSGDCNSGHCNSGHCNSGDHNSGNYNSGYRNSGDRNSGHCNSGHCNSGHHNSGHHNSGYFCTETPRPTFFDDPWNGSWEEAEALVPYLELPIGCDWIPSQSMSDQEKAEHPNHATIGGYLKKHDLPFKDAFQAAWQQTDEQTRHRFLNLPNFDAEKFFHITGVDVRTKPLPVPEAVLDEITLNGKRYRLVPIE